MEVKKIDLRSPEISDIDLLNDSFPFIPIVEDDDEFFEFETTGEDPYYIYTRNPDIDFISVGVEILKTEFEDAKNLSKKIHFIKQQLMDNGFFTENINNYDEKFIKYSVYTILYFITKINEILPEFILTLLSYNSVNQYITNSLKRAKKNNYFKFKEFFLNYLEPKQAETAALLVSVDQKDSSRVLKDIITYLTKNTLSVSFIFHMVKKLLDDKKTRIPKPILKLLYLLVTENLIREVNLWIYIFDNNLFHIQSFLDLFEVSVVES